MNDELKQTDEKGQQTDEKGQQTDEKGQQTDEKGQKGTAAPADAPQGLPEIDIRERGRTVDGQPQFFDRRLFMQLLVFRQLDRRPVSSAGSVGAFLARAGIRAVVYEDLNDPLGLGILTFSEDPAHFATKVRTTLGDPGLGLELRPDYTMLGRTYATGYETDLAFWLLDRPVRTVLDERHDWAIWYPLRRSGAFAKLSPREQGTILREHGTIGRAYAAKDLAHDVRLACHGLDAHDNEFVIGLIGKDLYPLSQIVEAMRKTRQTSEFISQMGPFFVGRAAHRSTG